MREKLNDVKSRRQADVDKERADVNSEALGELGDFKSQDYLQRKISMKCRARNIQKERQLQVGKNRVMINRQRENHTLKVIKAKERCPADDATGDSKFSPKNGSGICPPLPKARNKENQNQLRKVRLAKRIAVFKRIEDTEKASLKAFNTKAERAKQACKRPHSSTAWGNHFHSNMVPERPPPRASTSTPFGSKSNKNRTDFLEQFLSQRPSGKYNRAWAVPKEEPPLETTSILPSGNL